MIIFFIFVTNRPFQHSNEQWRRIKVRVDKNARNLWKCSPQPRSGLVLLIEVPCSCKTVFRLLRKQNQMNLKEKTGKKSMFTNFISERQEQILKKFEFISIVAIRQTNLLITSV